MMLRTRRSREAFTLVEILVVMGILALLVGLLVPASMRAADSVKRTQASTEMAQLGTAINQFKTKYNVDYIPSQIKLCDNFGAYGAMPLDIDSQVFLKTCWPNLGGSVDWNGNGNANDQVILQGDQCLVFFLGGINSGGQPIGFSTNPANPAYAGGNQRVGPFIQFQAERLVDLKGNGYRSYLDPWKRQVYAYFSNNGKINNYSKYGTSDCLALGVSPYLSNTGKFFNDGSSQIICAGKDKTFGPGGTTLPATGAGEDDQANFVQTPLGTK